MRWGLEGTGVALRSPFPWMALAATLALIAAGWHALERNRHDEARVQFERRTETALAAVRSRMLAYEQILRSGAAFMASSANVTRDDWRSFIANLQLEERFPGIQAVGYAQQLNGAAQRDSHLQRVRAEGFPDYAIHPPGERNDMAVVAYIEPFVGRNMRALGFDLHSEATRRDAIDRARASGEATITGRVEMGAEAALATHPQAGFLMVVPVYHEMMRDLPRRERANGVSGYVFGTFRMADLMPGIFDEGVLQVLDMRIHDQGDHGAPAELIDTRRAWRASAHDAPALFERIVRLPMPGRTWTVQLVSRPEFDAALAAARPWGALAVGVLAAGIVFLLVLALVAAWNRAHDLSMRDPLTGLFNRRYLEETMGRELPRARRLGQPVGIIVMDLDHFKALNDTHGHDAGDSVLARFGELLRHATRGSDIACRFGGEEFGVILPGASLEVARNRAEAIRAAYASLSVTFEGAPLGPLSLSAGVSVLPPDDADWPQAMRRADRALYAAKEQGRDRIVSA